MARIREPGSGRRAPGVPGSWKRRAREPESGGPETEPREEGTQALGSRRGGLGHWMQRAAVADTRRERLVTRRQDPERGAWL